MPTGVLFTRRGYSVKEFVLPGGDSREETMAQRLTRLREERGLTQAQLATKLTGVAGAGTVGGWESKEGKVPGLQTLIELSDLYNVELYYLATGRGPETRVPEAEAEQRLALIRQLLEAGLVLAKAQETADKMAAMDRLKGVMEEAAALLDLAAR